GNADAEAGVRLRPPLRVSGHALRVGLVLAGIDGVLEVAEVRRPAERAAAQRGQELAVAVRRVVAVDGRRGVDDLRILLRRHRGDERRDRHFRQVVRLVENDLVAGEATARAARARKETQPALHAAGDAAAVRTRDDGGARPEFHTFLAVGLRDA